MECLNNYILPVIWPVSRICNTAASSLSCGGQYPRASSKLSWHGNPYSYYHQNQWRIYARSVPCKLAHLIIHSDDDTSHRTMRRRYNLAEGFIKTHSHAEDLLLYQQVVNLWDVLRGRRRNHAQFTPQDKNNVQSFGNYLFTLFVFFPDGHTFRVTYAYFDT